MKLLDRVRAAGKAYIHSPAVWSNGQALRHAMRAFVLGQADVTPSDAAYGYGPETYQPAEYVDYLATSNAVYTCARLRAECLASLPARLYRGEGDNRKEVTSGQLYDLLHRVNKHWTFPRLVSMHEYSMCLWGECYWFLERGQSGRMPPQEIWWGRSDSTYVYPDPVEYIKGYGYMPRMGGMPIGYLPSEVIAFRYPNPANQWRGLSPLAAARLAADSANAAMRSNRNIFANGVQAGGFIGPPSGGMLTPEQARDLEEDISRRFKGVDKAHRWGVLRYDFALKEAGITPKDAEFLGMLKWTLEEGCRAYGIPLDLVGGQRTYENVNAALLALWMNTVIPEKRMIESELGEQLLPMFPGQADSVELDISGVAILKEDDQKTWTMANQQIERGVLTINEWRKEKGLDPVPWGDVWWGQSSLAPIKDAEPKPAPQPVLPAAPAQKLLPAGKDAPPSDDEQAPQDTEPRSRAMRSVEYGGAEHLRLWQAFCRSTEALEAKLTPAVQDVFRRQQDAVLARLQGRAARSAEEVADNPFDMARWVVILRTIVRPILRLIAEESGSEALKELGLAIAFDVSDPNVVRWLEQRAQRFAVEVMQTTWDMLKRALIAGIGEGEDIPTLAERVKDVMGDRIRSTPETIARTEVIGAYNGGTLQSWKQSGLRLVKTWLAALDDRVRDTHREAHGQTVKLDDDFEVGDGHGQAPGAIGLAEEDINCRCSMKATPLLDGEDI